MTFQAIEMPSSTPWGTDAFGVQVMPGIWSIDTARHGGFYVSPERRLASDFLQQWAPKTHNKQGLSGWYEEDVDWCIVALAFRDEWEARWPQTIKGAEKTFEYWIKNKA